MSVERLSAGITSGPLFPDSTCLTASLLFISLQQKASQSHTMGGLKERGTVVWVSVHVRMQKQIQGCYITKRVFDCPSR